MDNDILFASDPNWANDTDGKLWRIEKGLHFEKPRFSARKIRPIFKIHEKSETWLMIFLKKRLILFESPNFVWTKTIFWLL